MTIHFNRARKHLETFDFKSLFVEELGWARAGGRPAIVAVDSRKFSLTPMAELGGMIVYVCEIGDIPPANIRKKIDKEISKLAFEHIIIFMDTAHAKAVWLWVKREAGASARARENAYHKGEPGALLLQKLAGIAFNIEELDDEGRASIAAVVGKVAKAFDVEKITKRFYDLFKDEHTVFLKFVKGIDDTADRAWYASVILDRLMFIYFIQRKGFLDGDHDYLLNQLRQSKAKGRDRYYRDFLTALFFEGFAQEENERPAAVRKLLGGVPYLNGGLFLPHALEQKYGDKIQIPDSMFERLFEFFNQWDWHLDDRPPETRKENEINPDVLGYIFEKYINQKQMGAYYTKEDITGYICRSTILPFLIDKLDRLSDPDRALPIPDLDQYLRPADRDPLPMEGIGAHLNPKARQSAVFPLTAIDPYIYPAVKQAEYLPTETEREYAARQKRLAQIRADFKVGKINTVNDLITYNLDIQRVVADWLKNLSSPMTVSAFYFECLSKLTVLDPTVGSGAFLFAAMNILEPLYESCLDKMAEYVGPKHPAFEAELARIKTHPNRRYFIFKSIIVNNLFGVDIMEEATEICKLRLFLKLVSQVEDVNSIEPLPDIDFNIRAGNTLVGHVSPEQIQGASLFGFGVADKIREADAALRAFRDLQTKRGISARVLAKAKTDTRKLLTEIDGQLNETLKQEYGAKNLDVFVKSYRPFHWYVEFNSIMQGGGFDVIVGNPPYIEYSKIRQEYSVRGYETEDCGNLYAFVIERSFAMLRESGRLGMIVQLSSICTDRMTVLQKRMRDVSTTLWISNYDDRPAKLFDGLEHIRAAIIISQHSKGERTGTPTHSTNLMRWYTESRPSLFQTIAYGSVTSLEIAGSIPKIGDGQLKSLIGKVRRESRTVGHVYSAGARNIVYYYRSPLYWIRGMDFLPVFESATATRSVHHFKDFNLIAAKYVKPVGSLINSSLFYVWFIVYGNGRNVALRDIQTFPCDMERLWSDCGEELNNLFEKLMEDYKTHSRIWTRKDVVKLQEFYPSLSKPIIDEIDRVLAKHYGLTDEELDFIINYDIKYRMGKEREDE